MSDLSNRTFTDEEQTIIRGLFADGVETMNQIGALREHLKERVKEVSDQLDIKAALLNKAIKTSAKQSYQEDISKVEEVGELLVIAGESVE